MRLTEMTAHELRNLLDRGEVSSVEITRAVLDRIDRVEAGVKAYLSVDKEKALAQAAQADQRLRTGNDVTPLTGIPMALKDNICAVGTATTCASRMLENFVPPYDASVVDYLQKAGTVCVGKTNMDEFAMGSSTENSALETTKNPWDLTRVPGGSSGGSAAGVAAGEAVFALGSDTGGSIRLPAAFCGVVGLKPTYGLVSRYGLIAFASSLDQIGPITQDVEDCALVLAEIARYDPKDSTSLPGDRPDYRRFLTGSVRGLRLGVPREYFEQGIQPEVGQEVLKAINLLESLGASVEEVSLPHTEYALATYYLVATAEASSNLARYDGVRYGHRSANAPDTVTMFKNTRSEGFGPEVKRRIMLGTYALSAGYYDQYYLKALKVRTLIRGDFEKAFEKCDALVAPTAPFTAFRIGERVADPVQMYLADVCTTTANLAGIPALSLPCGFDGDGLPVGLQLLGPPLGEGKLLQVAYAFEKHAGIAPRKPALEVNAGG